MPDEWPVHASGAEILDPPPARARASMCVDWPVEAGAPKIVTPPPGPYQIIGAAPGAEYVRSHFLYCRPA